MKPTSPSAMEQWVSGRDVFYTNLEPAETKVIPITATIGQKSALRAKASVDGSVYRLNRLPDPQYPQFDNEVIGKTEYTRTFTLGTNSIRVRWKGKLGEGFKPAYSINGRPSTRADYDHIFAEAAKKLRVMRVLSFDFAD